MNTHALIAVDGSEAALQACRMVAAYAGDRARLRVTLLNVQRGPLRLSLQPGVPQAVLEEALLAQGEEVLRDARALLEAAGFAPQSAVRIGAPADTVLEAARELAADVLVLGSGRRGPLGGYALGSVALRAAPAAPCPAVLVQPGAPVPAAWGRTLRVVAPVDGSPESLLAVQRLAACAGLLGTLHVDLVHFAPGLTLAAAILPPHDDVMKEWGALDADSALAGPAQVLEAAGIAHTRHHLTGAPEAGIAAFAQQQGAGLIAMGTRGMGAMHHLLMGSVALRTARTSEVPVALLR